MVASDLIPLNESNRWRIVMRLTEAYSWGRAWAFCQVQQWRQPWLSGEDLYCPYYWDPACHLHPPDWVILQSCFCQQTPPDCATYLIAFATKYCIMYNLHVINKTKGCAAFATASYGCPDISLRFDISRWMKHLSWYFYFIYAYI